MAKYVNVFAQDAQRQAREAAEKERKRKPKKRPPKPSSGAAQAVRDIARSATQTSRAVSRSVPAPKPVRPQNLVGMGKKIKPGSAEAMLLQYARAGQERAKRSQPKPQNAGPFNYAGNLAGTQSDEGSILGRVLRGGAGDVIDIATGLPGFAVLAGRTALYPVAKPFDLAGVNLPIANASRTESLLAQAAKGIAEEYSRVYGPVLDVSLLDIVQNKDDARGKYRRFGGEIVDHPVLRGLDAAALFSGGGAALGAGARGVARVAPNTRVGRGAASLGDRSILPPGTPLPDGRVATGSRYRPPKEVTGRVSDVEGAAKKTVLVPRRPLTPNPLTRPVQRAVAPQLERFGEAVRRFADRRQVPEGSPARRGERAIGAITSPLTSQARFARSQKRGATDIIVRREAESDRLASDMVRKSGLDEALRHLGREHSRLPKMPRRHLTAEHLALRLHMEDVLSPRGGKSPTELRDLWVAERRPNLESAKASGQRTQRAERQLEQVAAIPDDLLDLSSGTPGALRVAAALEAAQKVGAESQRLNVEAGVITAEKAAEVASRRSAVGVGGARYALDVLREMKAAGASKAEIQAARRALIKETPELAKRREALRQSEADLGQAEIAARTGGSTSALKAATRKRDKYLKQVRKTEKKILQTARTKPTRPELVGSKAVYIKDRPIDRMNAAFGGGRSRGMSGPAKAQVSHDTLLQKAGFDMNPELLLREARRAADVSVGPMSREALAELIDLAAYLKDGKWVTGNRAVQLARADPDNAVTVSVNSLKKALEKIDELPEGKFLTADEAMIFHGRGKGLQALPDNAKAGDHILISKAAADVWRDTMTGSAVIQRYDNFMSWWKGGLLSLQPRWYINSTVGVATQWGLLTGGDFVSLVQANRKIGRAFKKGRQDGKIRASTPAEIVQNTLAENIVGSGAALASKPAGKAMMAGFRVNNRLEGFWRRGAHLSMAKRAYKREGVKVRGMSEGEIARLLDGMPVDMQRALARDMNTFMGDFRKFNSFEKKVLRRFFPFYSWLRVITRLTYRMPFRSPLRAQFLSIASQLGEVVNPLDPLREIYRRGAIELPGGIRLQTNAMNPAATLTGFFEAIGSNNPGKLVGELLSWSEPLTQAIVSQGTGIKPFAQRGPFSPTGHGGGAGVFGREAKKRNPATGLLEDVSPRVPVEEAVLEALVPFLASPARRLLAGKDTVYDTATTRQLAAERFPELKPLLFPKGLGLLGKPAKEKREVIYPRTRPKVDVPVGRSLPGVLGVPLLRENAQELIRKRRREELEQRKAERQTQKRIRRERARSR